jgi:hypothetical protein
MSSVIGNLRSSMPTWLGTAKVEIKETLNRSTLLGRKIKILAQSKLSSFKSLSAARTSIRQSLFPEAKPFKKTSEDRLSSPSYISHGKVDDYDLKLSLTAKKVEVASLAEVSKFKGQVPEIVITAPDSERSSLSPETLSFIKGTKELEDFFSDVF